MNLKNILPPNSTGINDVQTQPSASGPNPTINTTTAFQVPLPVDPLYSPSLTCFVFDHIYKGWSQPQIGTFKLPLGDIMLDLQEERDEETNKIEDINIELEKIFD